MVEENICIIVWDLGLPKNEKEKLLKTKVHINNYRNDILIYSYKFNFKLYPEHFNISHKAGYYAWKPYVIYNTYKMVKRSILWLDCGCFIKNKLQYEYNEIIKRKIWSITQHSTIKRFTHEYLLNLLDTDKFIYSKTMCTGGVLGIYYPSLLVTKIMNLWTACALIKKCISPNGSDLSNHRYDQSIISILLYQNNIECDNSQKLNFVTHFDTKYRSYNNSDYLKFIKSIS